MKTAIVIGGGPAGSVAAVLLARAGFDVDLLEQHSFPRDKVCGECLSGVGIDVLTRAGLIKSLKQVSPATLSRTLIHPAEGPSIDVPLPRASMGISRLKMDAILLHTAATVGVRVHQPARCEAVVAGPRPSIAWRDLKTNSRSERSADWIIIADGKGALLPASRKATGDLGIKTHFENINGPSDAIELFAGQGHYGGIAAVEGNRWNAAFSVPAALIKSCSGDIGRAFDIAVECNSKLRDRVARAKRVGPWLASPLPRFAVTNHWPDHVIPVGNAAAALEPVGGEGMGLALRSAELAAHAIIATSTRNDDSEVRNLSKNYAKLWKVRRTICRGIAMMFSNADFADAIAPLISSNLQIPSTMMRWAGKAG